MTQKALRFVFVGAKHAAINVYDGKATSSGAKEIVGSCTDGLFARYVAYRCLSFLGNLSATERESVVLLLVFSTQYSSSESERDRRIGNRGL